MNTPCPELVMLQIGWLTGALSVQCNRDVLSEASAKDPRLLQFVAMLHTRLGGILETARNQKAQG